MGVKKCEMEPKGKTPTVEYRAMCFGAYNELVADVQFLSTPVLHVNGPGKLAYHVLNQRFLDDLKRELPDWYPFVVVDLYIYRVNDDGTLRGVLFLPCNVHEWVLPIFECLLHDDCQLFDIRGTMSYAR